MRIFNVFLVFRRTVKLINVKFGWFVENTKPDLNFCEPVIQSRQFEEDQVDTDVDGPVRLGKKLSNSKYPRPLRVTVNDERTKWKILKMAKNLKDSGKEQYKEVYIKRDMTRMEREQDEKVRKQLREKRKEAEEKGQECKLIIRRGKLVNQKRRETGAGVEME